MTAARHASALLVAGLLVSLSAWSGEGRLAATMYSSQRAGARGDLIRVIVSEETSASKNHSQKASKEFSAAAAEGRIGNPNSSQTLPKALSLTLPSYSLSGSSEFSGDGGSATSETLATSLTAQVVDVLPNGILVIHGERLVTQGKEEVRMVLTGIVRRRDVTAENTVYSSQIADARIRYVSTGEVTRGSSPGWLSRLFQAVNPF